MANKTNFLSKNKLCPLCLGILNESEHHDCFPKGRIVSKKKDYVLIKVSKEEPIIERILKITNNKEDNSKEFILLYVNKVIIGYKSDELVRFIPEYVDIDHKQILETFGSKILKKKSSFEMM